ncbi:MAG: YabP/YqfC family sporulation protein [Bacilli bacterium]|nr:YabP/YqfC family sporulation protein [Bacilli bacterium]
MMDNKYEIIISNEKIYIRNYKRIFDINYLKIVIEVENNKIFINGNNLLIVKMDKYDIEINGKIKGISFENE